MAPSSALPASSQDESAQIPGLAPLLTIAQSANTAFLRKRGTRLTPNEHKQACEAYLAKRTGTYGFRCRRYERVGIALRGIGMRDHDILYDLGAGMCELAQYLYAQGYNYRYVPVDGCIDGTDLNGWRAPEADAFALVEVIEHLEYPGEFLWQLKQKAKKGIVLTTPNADRVDVLGMDETHRHALTAEFLEERGFEVLKLQLFNSFEDTLLARWKRR